MSDSDLAPPKQPKISEVIVGYVYLQVPLFVAIVYGMKNMEPWSYGVDRCEIVHYLYIAGFLITTLLILINYTEGRAETIAHREKIGATRTLIGQAGGVMVLLVLYLVVTHGPATSCETFFSGSDGFKSIVEAKNFIFSFVVVCASPAIMFVFLF